MTLTALRSRQDSDRPKNVTAVYQHFQDILESLKLSKKRHGDEMHDMAKGQLALAEEWTLMLGYALYPTDGHGRLLAPVYVLRRRRWLPLPGQTRLFEVP